MKRNLIVLILFCSFIYSGCRRYDNYPTIIHIIAGPDGFNGQFSVLENNSDAEFSSKPEYAVTRPGDTTTIEINWGENVYDEYNPRFRRITISYQEDDTIGYGAGPGGFVTVLKTIKKSDPKKISPAKIYVWDYANSNEIKYTGERSERYEPLFENGSVGIVGRWEIIRFQGSDLPYTFSSGWSLIEGYTDFNSDNTWNGRDIYRRDGQTENNTFGGEYTFSNGAGELLNSNNKESGRIEIIDGLLYWDDYEANYSYVLEKVN